MSTEPNGAPVRVACVVEAQTAGSPSICRRARPKAGRSCCCGCARRRAQPEKTVHVLDLDPAADGHATRRPRPGARPHGGPLGRVPAPGTRSRTPATPPRPARPPRPRRRTPAHRATPLAVRIPYVTKDGYLAVRAWLRPAHAETDRHRPHGPRDDGERPACTAPGSRREPTCGCACAAGPAPSARWSPGPRRTAGASPSRSATRSWPPRPARHRRLERLRQARAGRPRRSGSPASWTTWRTARRCSSTRAATVGGAVLRPYYTMDNDLSVKVTKAG